MSDALPAAFIDPPPVPTGPLLPAWLSLALEALDAGVADGDPVTTQTCPISGVVRTSAGSAAPIYRADYAGSGVAGYEYDGVDDIITTTTNVDLTAGYTYFALVWFDSPHVNYRVLLEQGAGDAQIYTVSEFGQHSLQAVSRTGPTELLKHRPTPIGQWLMLGIEINAASSKMIQNRSTVTTGTVRKPTLANVIRFGRATTVVTSGGMDGCVAADYLAPPGLTPTQYTDTFDYIAARHGVAL